MEAASLLVVTFCLYALAGVALASASEQRNSVAPADWPPAQRLPYAVACSGALLLLTLVATLRYGWVAGENWEDEYGGRFYWETLIVLYTGRRGR